MKKPTKRESEILEFIENIIAEQEAILEDYPHSTVKIVAQETVKNCENIKNFITEKV